MRLLAAAHSRLHQVRRNIVVQRRPEAQAGAPKERPPVRQRDRGGDEVTDRARRTGVVYNGRDRGPCIPTKPGADQAALVRVKLTFTAKTLS